MAKTLEITLPDWFEPLEAVFDKHGDIIDQVLWPLIFVLIFTALAISFSHVYMTQQEERAEEEVRRNRILEDMQCLVRQDDLERVCEKCSQDNVACGLLHVQQGQICLSLYYMCALIARAENQPCPRCAEHGWKLVAFRFIDQK